MDMFPHPAEMKINPFYPQCQMKTQKNRLNRCLKNGNVWASSHLRLIVFQQFSVPIHPLFSQGVSGRQRSSRFCRSWAGRFTYCHLESLIILLFFLSYRFKGFHTMNLNMDFLGLVYSTSGQLLSDPHGCSW